MLEGMVLALAIFALGVIAGVMLFLVLHWNDVGPDEGGGWEVPDYPPNDLDPRQRWRAAARTTAGRTRPLGGR